jgi:hypothetical protein
MEKSLAIFRTGLLRDCWTYLPMRPEMWPQ